MCFFFAAVFVLIIFNLMPLLNNFRISFFKWDYLTKPDFIGLANYVKLLSSGRFMQILKNTLVYAGLTVPVTTVFAFILALMLNRLIALKNIIRVLFLMPWIIPSVNIALIWLYIYEPEVGLLNEILKILNIQGPNWLNSMGLALPSLAMISVWKFTGYYSVIFLGGLQSISNDLYEAAKIDGASEWKSLIHITIPHITPTLFFILIVSIINAFKVFDLVKIMTNGGPGNQTNVIVYYLYEQAFKSFKSGYASAIAVILFIFLLVLTGIQVKMSKKWVHYA